MVCSSKELISSIRGVHCSPVKLEAKKRSDNISVLLHLTLGQLQFTPH